MPAEGVHVAVRMQGAVAPALPSSVVSVTADDIRSIISTATGIPYKGEKKERKKIPRTPAKKRNVSPQTPEQPLPQQRSTCGKSQSRDVYCRALLRTPTAKQQDEKKGEIISLPPRDDVKLPVLGAEAYWNGGQPRLRSDVVPPTPQRTPGPVSSRQLTGGMRSDAAERRRLLGPHRSPVPPPVADYRTPYSRNRTPRSGLRTGEKSVQYALYAPPVGWTPRVLAAQFANSPDVNMDKVSGQIGASPNTGASIAEKFLATNVSSPTEAELSRLQDVDDDEGRMSVHSAFGEEEDGRGYRKAPRDAREGGEGAKGGDGVVSEDSASDESDVEFDEDGFRRPTPERDSRRMIHAENKRLRALRKKQQRQQREMERKRKERDDDWDSVVMSTRPVVLWSDVRSGKQKDGEGMASMTEDQCGSPREHGGDANDGEQNADVTRMNMSMTARMLYPDEAAAAALGMSLGPGPVKGSGYYNQMNSVVGGIGWFLFGIPEHTRTKLVLRMLDASQRVPQPCFLAPVPSEYVKAPADRERSLDMIGAAGCPSAVILPTFIPRRFWSRDHILRMVKTRIRKGDDPDTKVSDLLRNFLNGDKSGSPSSAVVQSTAADNAAAAMAAVLQPLCVVEAASEAIDVLNENRGIDVRARVKMIRSTFMQIAEQENDMLQRLRSGDETVTVEAMRILYRRKLECLRESFKSSVPRAQVSDIDMNGEKEKPSGRNVAKEWAFRREQARFGRVARQDMTQEDIDAQDALEGALAGFEPFIPIVGDRTAFPSAVPTGRAAVVELATALDEMLAELRSDWSQALAEVGVTDVGELVRIVQGHADGASPVELSPRDRDGRPAEEKPRAPNLGRPVEPLQDRRVNEVIMGRSCRTETALESAAKIMRLVGGGSRLRSDWQVFALTQSRSAVATELQRGEEWYELETRDGVSYDKTTVEWNHTEKDSKGRGG